MYELERRQIILLFKLMSSGLEAGPILLGYSFKKRYMIYAYFMQGTPALFLMELLLTPALLQSCTELER